MLLDDYGAHQGHHYGDDEGRQHYADDGGRHHHGDDGGRSHYGDDRHRAMGHEDSLGIEHVVDVDHYLNEPSSPVPPPGFRTTTLQKYEAVPRRAPI